MTGTKFTYRQVSELTKQAASTLKRMGVDQKDVIAIHLPNAPEYAPIFFGIQAAGGIATTVNTMFTADEIANQLQDAGAKYIVSSSPLIDAAREGAAKASLPSDNVLDLASLWDLVCKDDGSYLAQVHTTENPSDEVTCLPYSSGTTGRPKGVMLTHTNFIAHAMILGNDKFMSKGPGVHQRVMMALIPFFHIYGISGLIGTFLYLGTKLVCMQKFDPEMFLKIIEQEKVKCQYLTLIHKPYIFLFQVIEYLIV